MHTSDKPTSEPVDPAKIRIRKVNYEALARENRRNAYRRAITNGYSAEDARKLAEIWGAPIEREFQYQP